MLDVDQLYFSIGDQQILSGISFSVLSGQSVGIIGPNGSGKTTLFNCLSGFNRVDSGTISLKGEDLTMLPAYERARRGIGRVFQNFGIFREMSVFDNLLVALESREGLMATFLPFSMRSRALRQEVSDALAEVGLASVKKKSASNLSGGQMRLLEIARTFACGSSVFLLDEPTAGGSPIMKGEVGTCINRLRQAGRTILIIEHDIEFVQRFCDRIIVLDGGKIVMDDTPEKVRNSDLLKQIYFGSEAPAEGAGILGRWDEAADTFIVSG